MFFAATSCSQLVVILLRVGAEAGKVVDVDVAVGSAECDRSSAGSSAQGFDLAGLQIAARQIYENAAATRRETCAPLPGFSSRGFPAMPRLAPARVIAPLSCTGINIGCRRTAANRAGRREIGTGGRQSRISDEGNSAGRIGAGSHERDIAQIGGQVARQAD